MCERKVTIELSRIEQMFCDDEGILSKYTEVSEDTIAEWLAEKGYSVKAKKPIEPIKAGVVIDENYFEEIVGRKPKSQDELATFASRVEKGIEVSCHWETVNDEARMEIERMEEKRAMEK